MKIYLKLILPTLLLCSNIFSMEEKPNKRKAAHIKTEQNLQNKLSSSLKKQKIDTTYIDELGHSIKFLEWKYNTVRGINQNKSLVSHDISQSDEALEDRLKNSLIISRIAHFLAQLEEPLLEYFLFWLFRSEIDDIINETIEKIENSSQTNFHAPLYQAKKRVQNKITEKYLLFLGIASAKNLILEGPKIIKNKEFLDKITAYFKTTLIDKIKVLDRNTLENVYEAMEYSQEFSFLAQYLAQTLLAQTQVKNLMDNKPLSWIIATDNVRALVEAFNKPGLISAKCERLDYLKHLDNESKIYSFLYGLLESAIKRKSFNIANFLIKCKFNQNDRKNMRLGGINLIAETLVILIYNKNNRELIDQCRSLIKALFENGTRLSLGNHEWGQYEWCRYMEALEHNPLFRQIEEEDYSNSIGKLIEDARENVEINPPKYHAQWNGPRCK